MVVFIVEQIVRCVFAIGGVADEGYIHIGLRHIKEWKFNDYYAERTMFQLKEEDVIPMLKLVVNAINADYQDKKEQRPDFLYRKFGKNSLYLNGDYYMIHIGKSGRIENFSKSVDYII